MDEVVLPDIRVRSEDASALQCTFNIFIANAYRTGDRLVLNHFYLINKSLPLWDADTVDGPSHTSYVHHYMVYITPYGKIYTSAQQSERGSHTHLIF